MNVSTRVLGRAGLGLRVLVGGVVVHLRCNSVPGQAGGATSLSKAGNSVPRAPGLDPRVILPGAMSTAAEGSVPCRDIVVGACGGMPAAAAASARLGPPVCIKLVSSIRGRPMLGWN